MDPSRDIVKCANDQMDIFWISIKQNIYRHPALIWTTPDFLSEIREGFGIQILYETAV